MINDRIASGVRNCSNVRNWLGIRRITMPTLLIGAENDRLLPDANTVGSYGRLIPQARTERVPGTGHALIIEQPDAVATTVLSFIKEAS